MISENSQLIEIPKEYQEIIYSDEDPKTPEFQILSEDILFNVGPPPVTSSNKKKAYYREKIHNAMNEKCLEIRIDNMTITSSTKTTSVIPIQMNKKRKYEQIELSPPNIKIEHRNAKRSRHNRMIDFEIVIINFDQ
jgi:hypothetical protein